MSPFAHHGSVPPLYQEAWAKALTDVITLYRDSQDDSGLVRSLKWLLILHDVLLRLPPRGGRRGRFVLSVRFAEWAEQDMQSLVGWWEHDR